MKVRGGFLIVLPPRVPSLTKYSMKETQQQEEPKFFLHNELIHWLQQNMHVSLHVNKEHIPDIILPDGTPISSDYEFANISVQITLNQQDVYKGDFAKTLYSIPVKLLIPKNDRAQWGGSTEREMKIYNDLHKMASAVNKLTDELLQLRAALQNIQYPLPEELK